MYPRYLADQQEVCIAHAAKRAAWVFSCFAQNCTEQSSHSIYTRAWRIQDLCLMPKFDYAGPGRRQRWPGTGSHRSRSQQSFGKESVEQ